MTIKTNTYALSPTGQEVFVLQIRRRYGEAFVRYADGTHQWLATRLMKTTKPMLEAEDIAARAASIPGAR